MNKTTNLFTSIRDNNNSRGCAKILEIPEGRGGYILGVGFGKSRGEGGSDGTSLLWGWDGYFLEPHITIKLCEFSFKIFVNYNCLFEKLH